MNTEKWFQDELSLLEGQWRRDGDLGAVAQAVSLCGWNGWPLPEWCVAPVHSALIAYSQVAKGQGQRSAADRLATLEADRIRHDLVTYLLKRGLPNGKKLSVDQACEQAAAMLKQQNVSGPSVRVSYYKIKRSKT